MLRFVGAGAQGVDVQAEEKATHSGVPHHSGLVDVFPQLLPLFLLEIMQHGVDRPHDDPLEARQAILMLIGVADPRDDIISVGCLRVLAGQGSNRLLAFHIQYLSHQRSRSHIYGQAQQFTLILAQGLLSNIP